MLAAGAGHAADFFGRHVARSACTGGI